jgi:type IV secretory pathway VirB10-like protein
VALVMVVIMALSGSPAKPRSTATPAASALAVDPNQQRIEEYQRRIQEQAQRLTAEQAQLQQAKDSASSASQAPSSLPLANPSHVDADRQPKAIAATANPAAREERGRFADNVAFSRSGGMVTGNPAGSSALAHAGAAPSDAAPAPAFPSPVQTPSPLPATPAPSPTPISPPAAHSTSPQQSARPSPVASAGAADTSPKYRVLEGTFIDTVLTNRLDGTFPGPVNCLVSVPVYASDQQHLVIPAGSRALGEARAVTAFGQSRLAVVFHRLILPNDVHIDLNGFHGLNQIGDLGLVDQVDRHYAQIFGVSLAIGAIGGLAQVQSGAALDATAFDAYRQGAAANVAQSSARILDRFLNLLPTVTIREGHRIKVYLSNDLEMPAYRDPLAATGGRP